MEKSSSWPEHEKAKLNLIIQSKKLFYLYMRENWNDPFFFTGLATTGYQADIRRKYGLDNPNLGMKLVLFGRYLHIKLFLHPEFWNFRSPDDRVIFLLKLYNRFKDKIEAKDIPNFKFKGNETDYIRELLERGFKAPSDVVFEEGDYFIRDKLHGLIFHKTSPSKDFLRDLYKKYAIKNYTTIIKY